MNKKSFNSLIWYKLWLFSLIASSSPSNFYTYNFMLKFHSLTSLIVSHSSPKAATETKRTKAYFNAHYVLVLSRKILTSVNRGHTAD